MKDTLLFDIDNYMMDDYFTKLKEDKEIVEKRFNIFEKWLENNDFNTLLYRMILKHDDEYRSRCYERGYEPYLNNIMRFIFKYVTQRGGKQVEVRELDNLFNNKIWEFNGYYFQIIWGQGVILKIFNKEDSREIFTI
jgi:hypothetical protein